MNYVKRIFSFSLVTLLLVLLSLSASPVFADRGMVPISEVSVYGPGQKAIIAWDGEQEILILSTDVYASGDSMVLEMLPLPSEPQRIEGGDFASFIQIQQLIEEHLPSSFWDRFMPGLEGRGEGVEVIFHQRIGAHDITVVKASATEELVQWAQGFLEGRGIEHDISSPKLERVVGSYIEDGIEFFVFDLIEVTSDPRSIEPIIYQFETDSLYYPLVISSLASGETEISLFLLTPGIIDFAELPRGMHPGLHYGQPVRFQLDEGDLEAIDSEIAQLLGDGAWLTAVKYDGDVEDLESDLRSYSAGSSAELAFLSLGGSCATVGESEATISLRGDRAFFSGSVIAPTPCHELRAKLRSPITLIYPPSIIVDITLYQRPGTICIQCIGEIPFRGEIRNLSPGEYDVSIVYHRRTIAQQRVEIPQVEPVELPIGATLEVDPTAEISVSVDGTPVIATVIEVRIIELPTYPPIYKELRIEVDEVFQEISIRVNGIWATIKQAIRIEDSQLFLETPQGPLLVRVMPDEVLQVLPEQEIQDFELKAVEGRPIFAVEGIVKAKLFGLIPTDMRIKSTVDAESGAILQEEAPWWALFCSLPGHGG